MDELPWMMKPLDEWDIVGMNHYHMHGKRRLFVAMTKDGRCIQEEGEDNIHLWDKLILKANAANNLCLCVGEGSGQLRPEKGDSMTVRVLEETLFRFQGDLPVFVQTPIGTLHPIGGVELASMIQGQVVPLIDQDPFSPEGSQPCIILFSSGGDQK